MKAYKLIASPTSWIKGMMCDDAQTCFCAVGAIRQKHGMSNWNEKPQYYADIAKLANIVNPHSFAALDKNDSVEHEAIITNWNDAEHRTHAEVLTAMKEADV